MILHPTEERARYINRVISCSSKNYIFLLSSLETKSRDTQSLRNISRVDNDQLDSLVAIHGLNGDPFDTWTHKDTGVMWLRDLLPEALPNIRIATFGYNARFKNFTAQQDLRSISLKLLTELADIRSAAEVGNTNNMVMFMIGLLLLI